MLTVSLSRAELERRAVEAHELLGERGYEDELRSVIESGRLRIEPEHRRKEALSFIRSGLTDFSVSRSRERARGSGIPVPDDPSQVIYVWFEALANYITALDYGTVSEDYHRWWKEADERAWGALHSLYVPGWRARKICLRRWDSSRGHCSRGRGAPKSPLRVHLRVQIVNQSHGEGAW